MKCIKEEKKINESMWTLQTICKWFMWHPRSRIRSTLNYTAILHYENTFDQQAF